MLVVTRLGGPAHPHGVSGRLPHWTRQVRCARNPHSFHRCFQSTGRAGAPCHGTNLGRVHFRSLRRVNRFWSCRWPWWTGQTIPRRGSSQSGTANSHGNAALISARSPATSATSGQTASEGPAAIDACSGAKTTSKKSARSGSKQATFYALAQFGFISPDFAVHANEKPRQHRVALAGLCSTTNKGTQAIPAGTTCSKP